jgi:hypothetical protein
MTIPLKGSIEHVAKKNQYFTTDRIEVVYCAGRIIQARHIGIADKRIIIRYTYLVYSLVLHTHL